MFFFVFFSVNTIGFAIRPLTEYSAPSGARYTVKQITLMPNNRILAVTVFVSRQKMICPLIIIGNKSTSKTIQIQKKKLTVIVWRASRSIYDKQINYRRPNLYPRQLPILRSRDLLRNLLPFPRAGPVSLLPLSIKVPPHR